MKLFLSRISSALTGAASIRVRRNGFLLVSAAMLSVPALYAQTETGSIAGTITDSSGSVVPHAVITVKNTNTGAVRNLTSGSNGDYQASGLQPAPYSITATAPGFGSATRTLNVSVGSANTVDVKLAVQGQETRVEVVADDLAGVNLENGSISQVIDSQQITELPTETRNPYDLTTLSGNVSSDTSIPAGSQRGVGGFSFSGARAASVDILLDGAENTSVFGVSVGQTVPLDSVQEFRVLTAGFGAEYGRASGGVVNVATRGGTNRFHGTAYEFYRPSTFASNDYNSNANGLPKGRFVRNNFGGSVGGPIVKDRLFFFDNLEYTRVRSNENIIAVVPTPQLIAAADPNTQAFFAKFGTLVHPINGQVYTVSQVRAGGVFAPSRTGVDSDPKFAALGPDFPAFGQVSYQVPSDSGGGIPQNTYDNVVRVDYNLSHKTTLFGRYALYSENDLAGSNNNSPYVGYNTGVKDYDNNVLGSLTHVWSTNVVTDTKFLFSRLNNFQPLGQVPVSPTLYVNSSQPVAIGGNSVYFPGYSAITPGNAIPFGGPQNLGEIAQDVNWTKGGHNFKFGGQYLYIKDNRVFGAYEEAVDALVQSGNRGAANAFLNGTIGFLNVAINPQGALPCIRNTTNGKYTVTPACTINKPVTQPSFSRSNRYHDAAAYAQDSWKVTPRFTFNYGLRWEFYGPQHSTHPGLDANFYFGTSGSYFDRIRAGQVLTRNQVAPPGVQSPDGNEWAPNYKQFAPRIGFAMDVFGDGKTSLRGSYGISYERNFNNVTFNVIQNPPNYAVVGLTTADNGGVPIPISTDNLASFGSGTGSTFLPNVTLRAVDPRIKPSYNHFWDLSLQRAVGANTTVEVSYTGERGIHNYSIANINKSGTGSVYLGDARTFGRLNTQYSNINFRGADGDSYYHGMNIGLRSSNLFHQGLTAIVNYTLAHATDNTSSTFTDGGANSNNLGYSDPFNHALDHGSADFDARHRIVVSTLWAIPYAHSTKGLLNRVLDGWELGDIFTATTGLPFTEFDCTNALTTCPRASFATTPQYHKKGDEQLLDPTVYGFNTFNYLTLPTPVEVVNDTTGLGDFPNCTGLGNVGCTFGQLETARNAFRGPGRFNLDADLNKNIRITETTSLQLRLEMYNVLNHANELLNTAGSNDVSVNALPDGSPYQPGYKEGRRQLQLGAKFIF